LITSYDGIPFLRLEVEGWLPDSSDYGYYDILYISSDCGASWRQHSIAELYGGKFIPYDTLRWLRNGGLNYSMTKDGGLTWSTYKSANQYYAPNCDDVAIGWYSSDIALAVRTDTEEQDLYLCDLENRKTLRIGSMDRLPFDSYSGSGKDFGVVFHNNQIWFIGQGGMIAHVSSEWRGMINEVDPVASQPMLSAWYPNPSNHVDVLSSIDLEARTNLCVAAYDVLGREVAKIFDGEAGPGRQTLRWNTGTVRPGVYFVAARTPLQIISTSKVIVK
jgi:hypothetical protein